MESSERQDVREILRVSSGISFASELINVSHVLEHVPSSRMRKRTHDVEIVQFVWGFDKRQRLCNQSSDKAIQLTCEGPRKLADAVISSGD